MSSRPIQTQPKGLLGFLQLKNQGQNPAELPDTLQSVLEMRDWYLQTSAEIVGGTPILINAAGTFDALTVPFGEWWFVHDVMVSYTMVAAATIAIAPAYRYGPQGFSSSGVPLAPIRQSSQATLGTVIRIPSEVTVPMFLPPGGRLAIVVGATSDITQNAVLIARITRLQS